MSNLPEEARSEDQKAEYMARAASPRWLSLDKFLRSVRTFVADPPSTISPTLVLGNPSADLDSFVSAVLYAYFHNHSESHIRNAKGDSKTFYIPLLNLPKTPSSELHRFRPEFDFAIQTAAAWKIPGDDPSRSSIEGNDSSILDQVITIHDLTTTLSSSPLAAYFNKNSQSLPSQPIPIVLVDHNVPCIVGFTPKELSSRLTVTGCIDHHVDESSGPQSYTPRIINLNAGSCTSLVISYLRSQKLFPDPSSNPPQNPDERVSTTALQQISSLALSSILVDTRNLKSHEKTKAVDLEAVKFLTSHLTQPGIHGGSFTPPNESPSEAAFASSSASQLASSSRVTSFFAEDYHRNLSNAKVNSLEKLNLEEIFERDYKQWSEPTSNSTSSAYIEIGISSVAQPISWLVKHTSSLEGRGQGNGDGSNSNNFASAIAKFGKSYDLDIYVLLTRPTPRGKGLAAVAFTDRGLATLEEFEKNGTDPLGLKRYDGDGDGDGDGGDVERRRSLEELRHAMESEFDGRNENKHRTWWRIWWLTKKENTRKQIAPLVRQSTKAVARSDG